LDFCFGDVLGKEPPLFKAVKILLYTRFGSIVIYRLEAEIFKSTWGVYVWHHHDRY